MGLSNLTRCLERILCFSICLLRSPAAANGSAPSGCVNIEAGDIIHFTPTVHATYSSSDGSMMNVTLLGGDVAPARGTYCWEGVLLWRPGCYWQFPSASVVCGGPFLNWTLDEENRNPLPIPFETSTWLNPGLCLNQKPLRDQNCNINSSFRSIPPICGQIRAVGHGYTTCPIGTTRILVERQCQQIASCIPDYSYMLAVNDSTLPKGCFVNNKGIFFNQHGEGGNSSVLNYLICIAPHWQEPKIVASLCVAGRPCNVNIDGALQIADNLRLTGAAENELPYASLFENFSLFAIKGSICERCDELLRFAALGQSWVRYKVMQSTDAWNNSLLLSQEETANFEPGSWLTCGCPALTMIRQPDSFATPLSPIYFSGPSKAVVEECAQGWRLCKVRVTGRRLTRGDHVRFVSRVAAQDSQPCASAERLSQNTTALEFESQYLPEISLSGCPEGFVILTRSDVLSGLPGEYTMCFCRSSSAYNMTPTGPYMSKLSKDPELVRVHIGTLTYTSDCTDHADFITTAGTLRLMGPKKYNDVVVHLGDPAGFTVDNVQGEGLDEGRDYVRLQRNCGEKFGEADVRGVITRSGNGYLYSFGRLSMMRAGRHELCWCRKDDARNQSCDGPDDYNYYAFFGIVHVRCPADKRLADLNDDGRCLACPWLWQVPEPDYRRCAFDLLAFLELLGVFSFGVIAFTMLFSLVGIQQRFPFVTGRCIRIEDIAIQGKDNNVIISTFWRHWLCTANCGVRVTFEYTGHFLLDSKPRTSNYFRVKRVTKDTLQLLTLAGEALGRADTSMGFLRLSLWRSLVHTYSLLGVPRILLVIIALTMYLTWLATESPKYVDESPKFFAYLGTTICVSLGVTLIMNNLPWLTKFDRMLAFYESTVVKERVPTACEHGPGRAIAIGVLFEFWRFFQSAIADRNMYYIDPNIVRPLTRRYQMSFAEFVGPSLVQFFVSHWWGNPFCDTCASLQKHAETSCETCEWPSLTYWICTFSNNQYLIKKELGSTHKESSFYLALHSDGCKGTCMILDETAQPLARSWCLFELLQTFNLERDRNNFQGLIFCTKTGVLNQGAATVLVSISIGKRIAAIRLEDAQASEQKDKDMINGLVISEMGSFEAINSKIREHVLDALHVQKDRMNERFESIFASLSHNDGDEAERDV